MVFNLHLTTAEGVVIESWRLSDDMSDPGADFVVPLLKLGQTMFVGELNRQIERAIRENEGTQAGK